ncbi:Protein-tyrosine-phosphatase [Lentibacillus sp. JNUCC-1]|nr:Protein-tyrosine-phosphatase [Lentibacillus sp. JNUCC-1]
MPLGLEGKYILLELPYDHVPDYTTNVVFEMQIAGYVPIISQPERNDEMTENPDKLYRLVKNGALVQLGAANVAGKGGKKVAKFTERLIKANQAHIIATGRQPRVKNKLFVQSAYQQVKKAAGSERVIQLKNNLDAIVTGKTLLLNPPERVTQKRWFF